MYVLWLLTDCEGWGLSLMMKEQVLRFQHKYSSPQTKNIILAFIDRIGGLFLIRFGYISIQGRAGVVRLWQGGNATLLWHLCDHHRSSRECDPWPRDRVTRGCLTFHCGSGLIDILSPLRAWWWWEEDTSRQAQLSYKTIRCSMFWVCA